MIPAFLLIAMCVNWGSQSSGGGIPPSSNPTPVIYSSWRFSDESKRNNFLLNSTNTCVESEESSDSFQSPNRTVKSLHIVERGGGSSSPNNQGILEGGKTVVTRATTFWKSKFEEAISSMKGRFQSKEAKKKQKFLEEVENLPIRQVVVPNTTVLPSDVVRTAVKRSGMIGSPLKMDRVQELGRNLKRWYIRQGYILHSVTGATLDPDTGIASISVEEPVVSALPVDIVYCKEMVKDPDTNELYTFKKYKAKKLKEMEKESRGLPMFRRDDLKIDIKDLNTTFVTTKGRTKPLKVAQALRLNPGRPFQWFDDRWTTIRTCGVFSKVLKASPEPASDGGVCLQVFVTEPAPRHLEYGIGKSVWTDAWEGEVDFDWRNVFGGDESAGVMVRRGSKDSFPSIRLRYADEKFGLEGGYEIEAFNDFLDDTGSDDEKQEAAGETDDPSSGSGLDESSLLNRRGATFRLRNPISQRIMTNSVASASLERTSTTTGQTENIGSAKLTLGPFRRLLPMEARSSVSTTISGGTRVLGNLDGKINGQEVSFKNTDFLPFSSASATTIQILPISPSSRQKTKAPVTLALQHTLSMSTPNLPPHEAKVMGHMAQIRGAAPDDLPSSMVKGTTEIRLPIDVPRLGSGTVVMFGDWFCVQKDLKSPFYSKSSIGFGVRKNISGLPLKYDVCYSSEKKFRQMFSMGKDFDV